MIEFSKPLRIKTLHLQNYRNLRDVRLRNLTPLTVFIGPNGSGKSTILDALAFLSDCFTEGLRKACDRRGRFQELRSRDSCGPITIVLQYRDKPDEHPYTYYLAIDEKDNKPFVRREVLYSTKIDTGTYFPILDYHEGKGKIAVNQHQYIEKHLSNSEILAVNAVGQLTENPQISKLRKFITNWQFSHLSTNATRLISESKASEHLSKTGDNLANVIQQLIKNHPTSLSKITKTLQHYIPHIEQIITNPQVDEYPLLQIKNIDSSTPMQARFASDGTLQLLTTLTLLSTPNPPQLLGIEHPENYIYPQLLPELVKQYIDTTKRAQLFMTTHSPVIIDQLLPKQVYMLYRDKNGYTHAKQITDIDTVNPHFKKGTSLGTLWMKGYFDQNNSIDE
jgi:predicted ATPase